MDKIITTSFEESINGIFFFDEADTIKIPACNSIKTSFTWFITSTFINMVFPVGRRIYTNIEQTRFSLTYQYHGDGDCRFQYWICRGLRHTGFIKNTMNSIDESIVKHIVLKNDDQFVQSSFRLPDLVMEIIKCKTPLSLSVLHNNVSRLHNVFEYEMTAV